MKFSSSRWLAALLGLTGLFTAQAAPPAYSDGDLLLGFRASGDPNANLDLVVNLGAASQFTNASAPFTVNTGDLSAQLAIFTDVTGLAWSARPDLYWSAIGTDLPGDPTYTIYASRPRQAAATQTAPWDRGTYGQQSSTNSIVRAAISGFRLSTAKANNPRVTVQSTSSPNSWASFTFGGTDFNTFDGIEADFTNGTLNSVLDLYRLAPTTQNAAGAGLIFVGSLKLDNAGVLTFTPPVATEPNFRLSALTYEAYEETGTVTVQVIRGGLLSGTDTVQISTENGTAIAGTDYTVVSGQTVTFGPNETQKPISITVANIAGTQGNRSFTVALSAQSAGVLNTPSTATIRIHDGAPPQFGELSFAAPTYNIAPVDANAAPTVLTVPVSRANGSDGAVSVTVAAGTGGTLAIGTDYSVSPTTVQFAAGETSKNVTVTLSAIAAARLPGSIVLELKDAQGGAVLGSAVTTTINVAAKDETVPTLSVTTKPSTIITTQGFTVAGKVGDNAGISRIAVSVNGGAAQTVQPAPDGTFSLPGLALENGKNTVTITAFDSSGNPSKTVTLKATYKNSRPGLAGSYQGLVLPSGTPSNNTTGYATITVAPLGTFTGSVKLGPAVLPIRGVIDNAGAAHFNVTGDTTAAATTLALTRKVKTVTEQYGTLAFSVAGGQASGTVKNGATLLANLSTDRKVLDGRTVATSVAASYLVNGGKCTVAIQAQAAQTGLTPPDFPQGFGYATLTVKKNGTATLVGKLADGTTISAGAPLTPVAVPALAQTYRWPLFARLYPKLGGVFAGKVIFDDTQANTDLSATGLIWIRPAQGTAKQYTAGWPNGILTDLSGAKYAPVSGASIIPGLKATDATNGNATVQLADGELVPTPQTKTINIDTKNKVTAVSDPTLKLTLVVKTGLFNGKFLHSDGSTLPYLGAVLQKGANAGGYGYFLSNPPTGQSGSVVIKAIP